MALKIPLLIGSLVLCFAVALTGGLATAEGVQTWYPTLDKPPWTPPNQAFGPIWTFLYAAMAVAAWDVARRAPEAGKPALALFLLQLGLNALWSPLFFAWQEVGLALVVLTALWGAVAACLAAFWRHSTLAGLLMVPYLIWLTIAWSLNAWIWWFG